MTPREQQVFDLVKADMDRSVEQMRHILEVELFHNDPFLARIPPTPPCPWWIRWRVRTITYLYTLWRALRGDELDTPYEGDGY